MAHPGDSDIATLREIMDGNEEEAGSDQSNWVRRSSRPVQPISPNAAANDEEENTKTASEVKNKQVQPTNATTAATAANRAAANNEEDANPAAEENPEPTKKARGRRRKQPRDTVQLFAFDDGTVAGLASARDGGRPKRKLKAVARFDSQSYGAQSGGARCAAGHGFNCPRCAHVCSYDSKACAQCGLTCSYEAGVGVVVLRERDDVGVRPRKRGRAAAGAGAGDDAAAEKGGRKTETRARRKERKKVVGRGGRAKRNAKRPPSKSGSSASAAASAPSKSAAAKSAFAAAKWAQSSAAAYAAAQSASAATDSPSVSPPPVRPFPRKRLKKKKVDTDTDAAGDDGDGGGDGGKGRSKKIDASVAGDDGGDGGGGDRCMGTAVQGKHLLPARPVARKRLKKKKVSADAAGDGGDVGGDRVGDGGEEPSKKEEISASVTSDDGGDGGDSNRCVGIVGQGKHLLPPPPPQDGAESPSHEALSGQGKRLLLPPPRDGAESTSLAEMGGKGKRLLPDDDAASTGSSTTDQRPSYATFGGSHATGGKAFGRSLGKSLANVPGDPEDNDCADDAREDKSALLRDAAGGTDRRSSRTALWGSHAKGGKTFGWSVGKSLASIPGDDGTQTGGASPAGGGRRPIRPVVALHERRPFVIREYPSLGDARKDLGAYTNLIRERSNYNQEHCRRKKMNKGKFAHYDFRDASDVRTARRWQRELLAAKHEDFVECDNLTEARGRPSWPVRLADAHHRMRMGWRILKFMRPLVKGQSCKLPPVQERGKCVRAISNHVSFAENLANHNDERKLAHKESDSADEEMDSAEEDDGHDDEDDCEVAKGVIVTARRDRVQPSTGSQQQLSEHVARLHDSASLPDFGSFGRTESEEEHAMVNLLNEDFPPEDHPLECFASKRKLSNDMTNQNLDAKTQETNQSLQAGTDEKRDLEGKLKDVQTKYNSLVSSSSKQMSELEEKLRVVSSERDDLAKKVGDMASMQLERDELAQRLEEANAKIQVWENIEKQIDAKNIKEAEEKMCVVSELTEKLSTTAAEKASALEKLGSAVSDLAAAREKAETQTIEILGLKSSIKSMTKQRDSANSRVSELFTGNNGNNNGILSSLMSERNALAASVEESMVMVTRLETEKLAAVAKSASLEDTVEELLGRVESLSAELHASKQANGSNFINESEQEKPTEESMQPDFVDGEDAQNCTIAKLKNIIEQQNDKVKALSENVATSNTHVTELTVQIFKLTSERDDLATKVGEVTGEVSNLQSAIETMQAERDAAREKAQGLQSGNTYTEKILSALNSEKGILIAKIEECIARLYSEKEESMPNSNGTGVAPTNGRHRSRWDNGSTSPMEKLEKQLRDRSAEVSKLTRDKEKLEAYTKQTLQIFQEKYVAITRDYKAKLKDKTETIHALENELANTKTDTQNGPLLSSAIDLGHRDAAGPATSRPSYANRTAGGTSWKPPLQPPPVASPRQHQFQPQNPLFQRKPPPPYGGSPEYDATSDTTHDTTHDTATADGSSDIAKRKAPTGINE